MLFSTEEFFQEILLNRNLVSIDQTLIVQKELKKKKNSYSSINTPLRLDEIYIKFGFISQQAAQQILTEITGFQYIDLNELRLNKDIFRLIDEKIQKNCFSVVFDYFEQILKIAMYDPEDLSLKDVLLQSISSSNVFGPNTKITFFYANKVEILKIYKNFCVFDEKNEKNYISENNADLNYYNVVDSIDTILQEAVANNASDVHFHPEQFVVRVRQRIDGILHTDCSIHKDVWRNFLVRFKILSNLDISESRRPQSGHFEKEVNGKMCDFRVSTHPTVFGESIVIRILQKNRKILTLDQLGFEEKVVEQLKNIIKAPHGLILLCGPTGSGKTTTLYTLCSCLNSETLNVMTLEDPIESLLNGIRQTEIRENGVLSFTEGIRSILRQDPDVIFIGEIRDEDTAQIALRASLTGHLVLSTLHVNDVLHIPNRLYDLGLKPLMLSGQLLFLMSQRLARKICVNCSGKGCKQCKNSGFKGRFAITETLEINAEIDRLILEQASIQTLFETARKYGFNTMYEGGMERVKQGLTTRQEIDRLVKNVYTGVPKECGF
ncbi:MAG: type II/IV secretion system protein [Holosporales bacterium]|jgi:general secretion pathway protein E/type IV pilus assembly protein PilB|nr:type II/IV secretion system protein [Holosporales bacterium]